MSDSTFYCQTCRNVAVTKFLSLGPQPPCHFLKNAEEAADEQFYPLDLAFCPKCSLVQIAEPVDERVLFGNDYHHIAGLTNSFRQHLRGLAAELSELPNPTSRRRVAIEIGS